MTSTVLPASRRESACCTGDSFSTSREAVASSSSTMGASFKMRAGDGDALALAAREQRSVLADGRVVALGQLAHELVAVGGLGRGEHLLVGGVAPARGGCSPSRCRRRAPRPGTPRSSRVRSVSGSTPATSTPPTVIVPRSHVPEAGCQLRGGGLAGSRGPHQRGHLALPGREAHVGEHRLAVLVGKRHPVEDDVVTLGREGHRAHSGPAPARWPACGRATSACQ